jgi:LCP family protein required for cell wall assembly
MANEDGPGTTGEWETSMSGDLARPESHATDEATGRPFTPTPYPRGRKAPVPEAPKPPLTSTQRSKVAGKVAVSLLSIAALLATGIGWSAATWFRSNTNTADLIHNADTGDDAVPSPPADDGAEDILLVGSDSRTDAMGNPLPLSMLKMLRTEATQGVNTDTIIILRVPRGGGKAHAISIPRDTYVDIPGFGEDKINSAYMRGKSAEEKRLAGQGDTDHFDVTQKSNGAGARELIHTVEQLTNVHIDHYAEVNLYGFYLLTEAVGGVPVCLRAATKDKDSGADFKAGYQKVTGGEALSFVRQRKNLPDGDLDRITRQQVFLASAANQVLSAGTLSSPTKLADLVDTVRRSMLMDSGMDILKFIQQAQSLTSGNVEFNTIPVLNINGHDYRGQSIVQVDKNAVKQFVARQASGSSAATPKKHPTSQSAPSAVGTATVPAAVSTPLTDKPLTAEPLTAAPPSTRNGVRCVN